MLNYPNQMKEVKCLKENLMKLFYILVGTKMKGVLDKASSNAWAGQQ
jgi:hypothetical protein